MRLKSSAALSLCSSCPFPPREGVGSPAPTKVTLKVVERTKIHVPGVLEATITDLKAGDRVEARYEENSLTALSTSAKAPPKHQLRGGQDPISVVDAAAGTVSIDVTKSLRPAGANTDQAAVPQVLLTLEVTERTKIQVPAVREATIADLDADNRV